MTFHRSTLWQGKINEKKGALKISKYCFLYFAVPENIYTHHKGGLWALNSHFVFKCSVKLNWKFQGGGTGWQGQTKEPSSGRYGYRFGTTQCDIKQRCFLIKMI